MATKTLPRANISRAESANKSNLATSPNKHRPASHASSSSSLSSSGSSFSSDTSDTDNPFATYATDTGHEGGGANGKNASGVIQTQPASFENVVGAAGDDVDNTTNKRRNRNTRTEGDETPSSSSKRRRAPKSSTPVSLDLNVVGSNNAKKRATASKGRDFRIIPFASYLAIQRSSGNNVTSDGATDGVAFKKLQNKRDIHSLEKRREVRLTSGARKLLNQLGACVLFEFIETSRCVCNGEKLKKLLASHITTAVRLLFPPSQRVVVASHMARVGSRYKNYIREIEATRKTKDKTANKMPSNAGISKKKSTAAIKNGVSGGGQKKH